MNTLSKTFSIPRTSILVFTDGACSGNPGPGGWGALILFQDHQLIEFGGHHPATTNNRMELEAAIQALQEIEKRVEGSPSVQLHTDSTYVIRGITEWIRGWERNGWKNSAGKPVANMDLWSSLSEITKGKRIEWKYVKGHAGNPGNERVDEIAVQFSQRKRPQLYEGHFREYPIKL